MNHMFSKAMKVLPRFKWLTAFVPSPVKEWLRTSDKSFVPAVDDQLYSDNLKHPAESRMIRVTDSTPRP